MSSLREAVNALQRRHAEYIEATYHIGSRRLIKERKEILGAPGQTVSHPWLEATPPYKSAGSIGTLDLPPPVEKLLQALAKKKLGVIDPPYVHQAEALRAFFAKGRDLVVSTGTGSGKTEVFLYSILGALAMEADRAKTTRVRGIRAMILYPMNALVSDQLARLRRSLGDPTAAGIIAEQFGRIAQFGMYTGRTPYHGAYDEDKNERYVAPAIKYFAALEADQGRKTLFRELKKRGRIPSKDLTGFAGGRLRATRYHTQPGDRELFTRQEMHSPNEFGGTPDILITNYSMLEYMLLRPIEQTMFQSTREWLRQDTANQLILVIDEAHLYRGAQGAEVAMLIRRLLQHLEVPRSRIRCILTSASLGAREGAAKNGRAFAARLTAAPEDTFEVILGNRRELGGKLPLPPSLGQALKGISPDLSTSSLGPAAVYFGWGGQMPVEREKLLAFVGGRLATRPEFAAFHDLLAKGPITLPAAASLLFPELPQEDAMDAALNFALMASAATQPQGEEIVPLLPVRLHLMFRGLPVQWICLNSACPARRAQEEASLLGLEFLSPRLTCPHCDSRVFELLTHRTCGAAYIRAFTTSRELRPPVFLWAERETPELTEIHVLVETPRTDSDPMNQDVPFIEQVPAYAIDTTTGYLVADGPETRSPPFIRCWLPPVQPRASPKKGGGKKPQKSEKADDLPLSWNRCLVCGINERPWKGQTHIMDLETKGEDPFAHLVKNLFALQPPVAASPAAGERPLPNQGRKVLCFSDGRQKAARLARDLQRTVEQDSFREMLMLAASRLAKDATMDQLFAAFVLVGLEKNIGIFDDGDGPEGGGDYPGSRSLFHGAQADLSRIQVEYRFNRMADVLADEWARRELDGKRPRQYDQNLLRALGDRNFSLRSAMVGFVAPHPGTLRVIREFCTGIDGELLGNIVLATIEHALGKRAYDPRIQDDDRILSRRALTAPSGYPETEGEGIRGETLVPAEIQHALQGVDEPQIASIMTSMKRGGPNREPPLFVAERGRYWLNPSALILRNALDHDWFQCSGCRRLTPYSFDGRCPDDECGAATNVLPADDLYIETRKSFLRKPVADVLAGRRDPFTLRSEEHTAQLNSKDASQVFGRAERYELLFQDVLIGDLGSEQPVDVLSCTTTMEVGIDIGSLTAVALRTVPPRADNYQQRSGRAGRRGSALSMILTFADNSPYENHIFSHPELLIGVDPGAPSIYVGNVRIAERHLCASILQAFFQRRLGENREGPEPSVQTRNVFESLGTAAAFFDEEGPYSLSELRKWLISEFANAGSPHVKRLGEVLSAEMASVSSFAAKEGWREAFVLQTSKDFMAALEELKARANWGKADQEGAELLPTLLDAGLLPTFSFPIDVCGFTVRDYDHRTKRLGNRYEMALGTGQALSEYIPGREIVVDKHTFVSYGLYFPFSRDPVSRGRSVAWDSLPWLALCEACGTVLEVSSENRSAVPAQCRVCGGDTLVTNKWLKPLGFAPRVSQSRGAVEGAQREAERVYATRACFPFPIKPPEHAPQPGRRVSSMATVRGLSNERLIVANYGPRAEGFHVCAECGATSLEGPLPPKHDRPYQIEHWLLRGRPAQCSGASEVVVLAYDLRTDLAMLSIAANSALELTFGADWFKGAAFSLSEALVQGASRVLGIEETELAGNWRVAPPHDNDASDVRGYLEFFLYDTTPGGAGFAARTADRMEAVIDAARDILASCDCDSSCTKCLRTYENRTYHETLNRNLANALLDYATTGQVPLLDPEHSKKLQRRIAAALALIDPETKISPARGNNIVILRGGKVLNVRLGSVLEHVPGMLSRGGKVLRRLPGDAGLRCSDHDVEHKLPFVVGEIVAELQ